MVKIRKVFDESTHEGVVFKEASLTQQHFKDECDINHILDMYTRTGELPLNPKEMKYADVSSITDYASMRAAIAQADSDFSELPSSVRERYHNDTSEFLDAIATEEGRREFESLMGVDGFSPRAAVGRDGQDKESVTAKAAGGSEQGLLDVTVPSDTDK